ncbi:MAG TPA: MBL fold metallo-hydrolase, partial [Candidatus Dormibacteraeota bacterium]|nr:MBL fold metallo-hydrolase [Candidatus Dormibacteraeota bacterium]
MEIEAGIDRYTLGISNWYVVGDGGKLTVVDAGTRGDWKLLQRALAQHGRTLHDVDVILLTHAHADHTGFAERARAEGGVTVRVHEADAEAARTGKVGARDGGLTKYLLRRETYRTVFGLARTGGVSIAPIKEVSSFRAGEV